MPRLKITMVGTSGTGKSCYLYGTYSRLLDGVGNFSFCPSDIIQGLELRNRWDTFIYEGTWPPGTDETTNFAFNILLNGSKIADFDWIDYRGGILDGQGDFKDQLRNFQSYLRDSNGVLVCIPADLLKAACLSSGEDPRLKRNALSVITSYQMLLGQISDCSIPVVLMITKGDYITKKEEYRTILKFLKEKFQVLFQSNSPAVMIARVRLGKFGPDQVQGGPVTGDVEPVNLHVPILFPVWMALNEQVRDLEKRISSQKREQGRNAQELREANNLGWFGRLIHGDARPALNGQKEEIRKMIQGLGRNLESLQEMVDFIQEEFEGNADIFIGGDCILNGSSFAEE